MHERRHASSLYIAHITVFVRVPCMRVYVCEDGGEGRGGRERGVKGEDYSENRADPSGEPPSLNSAFRTLKRAPSFLWQTLHNPS